MAKLTQAQIKEKLEAWAAVETDLRKAEANLEKVMAPIIEDHQINLAAATSKIDKKISTLTASSIELSTEIEEWLNKQPKAVKLETERAIAQLQINMIPKVGPRVVDPQKFIETATAQRKDPWPCIKVEVGKAEKLLGPKDIDTVSTRPQTTIEQRVATVELKA